MADNRPPSKRHRQLAALTSSFSRHLSNTRISTGPKSKLRRKAKPEPLPEPNSSPTSSSSVDYVEEEDRDEEVLMYGEEMTVQADFAFFDPKPGDFCSVKMLMNTYLDDYIWDVSGFVDLILQQNTVGSVIKLDDQEDDGGVVSEKNDNKEGDVFGVISALNIGRYTVTISTDTNGPFLTVDMESFYNQITHHHFNFKAIIKNQEQMDEDGNKV